VGAPPGPASLVRTTRTETADRRGDVLRGERVAVARVIGPEVDDDKIERHVRVQAREQVGEPVPAVGNGTVERRRAAVQALCGHLPFVSEGAGEPDRPADVAREALVRRGVGAPRIRVAEAEDRPHQRWTRIAFQVAGAHVVDPREQVVEVVVLRVQVAPRECVVAARRELADELGRELGRCPRRVGRERGRHLRLDQAG